MFNLIKAYVGGTGGLIFLLGMPVIILWDIAIVDLLAVAYLVTISPCLVIWWATLINLVNEIGAGNDTRLD